MTYFLTHCLAGNGSKKDSSNDESFALFKDKEIFN
jgi:hypothetical protein